METQEFYPIHDYGVVFSEDDMHKLAAEVYGFSRYGKFSEYSEAKWKQDKYHFIEMLTEDFGLSTLRGFTGLTYKLTNDATRDWLAPVEVYKDGVCWYAGVLRYPSLVEKAYSGMCEIVEEFKARFRNCLPADFDYRDRLRYIEGIVGEDSILH